MLSRNALALLLAMLWLWPASLHAQSEASMEAYNPGFTIHNAVYSKVQDAVFICWEDT